MKFLILFKCASNLKPVGCSCTLQRVGEFLLFILQDGRPFFGGVGPYPECPFSAAQLLLGGRVIGEFPRLLHLAFLPLLSPADWELISSLAAQRGYGTYDCWGNVPIACDAMWAWDASQARPGLTSPQGFHSDLALRLAPVVGRGCPDQLDRGMAFRVILSCTEFSQFRSICRSRACGEVARRQALGETKTK